MVYIGTSGWNYGHWTPKFYPLGLPGRSQLSFLAQHFPTVELNASFYRLPTAASFAHWAEITTDEFRFAVKVPKSITHNKRLAEVQLLWNELTDHAAAMGNKLGVYLLQFPPSFQATPETLLRLEAFLSYAATPGTNLAGEFRHQSWFEPTTLAWLKQHQFCLVQADSSRYPHSPAGFSSAPFAYYRLHGPRELYASQYSEAEMATWAQMIRVERDAGKDVFVYFDNDIHGFGIDDARALQHLLA